MEDVQIFILSVNSERGNELEDCSEAEQGLRCGPWWPGTQQKRIFKGCGKKQCRSTGGSAGSENEAFLDSKEKNVEEREESCESTCSGGEE